MLTNNTVWTRYRVTFGPPVSGDRIQVGEMRLLGEAMPAVALRSSGANVLLSWTNNPGYTLERRTTFAGGSWNAVTAPPVLSNGVNTVTLTRSGAGAYFRLRK